MMNRILRSMLLVVAAIFSALAVAQGTGTLDDPIIIESGVPANGPKACESFGDYTYYQLTAPADGKLTFRFNFVGEHRHEIYLGSDVHYQLVPLTVAYDVTEGMVIKVGIFCDQDNTTNTFTATVTPYQEDEGPVQAVVLNEGENAIPQISSRDPRWYKFTCPAGMTGNLTFGEDKWPALSAFVGLDAAKTGRTPFTTNIPVRYANFSDKDVEVYVKITSTNDEELTATLTLEKAHSDCTRLGNPQWSVGDVVLHDECTIAKGTKKVHISFPDRVGGADDDELMVDYILVVPNEDGLPDGQAPKKSGSIYGKLGEGVDLSIVTLLPRYLLRIYGGVSVVTSTGKYWAPGMNEPDFKTDLVFNTGSETIDGIENIEQNTTVAPAYNLMGQKAAKGGQIIIRNGKKVWTTK